MNSDNDMPDVQEEENDGVIPGGGPAEDEDASIQMPNPDAAHPDYLQTMPGHSTPASDVETGTTKESGSDNNES